MRNKKGDISIQMIIMAILGLVVLVILIFIFKEQISNVSQKYFGITERVEQEASGEICTVMFGGRKCMDSCEDPYIYDLGTEFTDCKKKNFHCCAAESGL